jgi:sodium-dependent dicarboxylate transporter 2/3/5
MKKTAIYFLISFLAGIITYFLPLGIPTQAHIVLSILVTVGLLWLTEAMPIHVTSLLIPFLLVVFANLNLTEVFIPFFDPVVVLLMGGFALAYGLQKFKLDEVVAYFFIHNIGTSPKRFLFAIMLATAFLSMWMSNSATTAVMMPIVVVILVDSGLKPFQSSYAKAAVLGVAFAATIGGLSTVVGTTPNAMAVKFLADQNIILSFSGWMYHTLPFTMIFLVVSWFILTLIYRSDIRKLHVRRYYHRLNEEQKRILIIFVITVFLWLTAGLHKISISLIALVPIFLFYILKLFDSKDFGNFHWDILILVGGGLSLGAAISSSGLNVIMADVMRIIVGGHPILIILFLTSLFCILMTMFSSNTGTASFIIPTIIPLATALGIDAKIMVILAGVSVSLDFLVPIGTPPNAIAYSTGYIHIKDMIKAGIILAVLGAFLLSFMGWLYW